MRAHCKILHCRILDVFILVCFVSCMLMFSGCREDNKISSAVSDDYVLKCGSILISPDDFSEALEIEESAYPYNINSNAEKYKNLVLDLAAQISQELVLRAAAAEDGISVSEQEINDAAKKIEKDFPGDSFQKMLLDNAVSYSLWKKQLGIRLLINRFIDKSFKDKIEISSEEIEDYYHLHKLSLNKLSLHKLSGKLKKNDGVQQVYKDEILISHLRSQKAEQEYPAWINSLSKKFPVEINKKKLSSLLHLTEFKTE